MSRAKKQFQILRRLSKDSKQVFYVAFRLPDDSLSSQRSSGQKSKGAAQTWAIEQIKSGKVPSEKSKVTGKREELIAFLTDFWERRLGHSAIAITEKYLRNTLALDTEKL